MTNTQDLLALWHERGKRIAELEEALSVAQSLNDYAAKVQKVQAERITKLEAALSTAIDDMPPITTRDQVRAVLHPEGWIT